MYRLLNDSMEEQDTFGDFETLGELNDFLLENPELAKSSMVLNMETGNKFKPDYPTRVSPNWRKFGRY